MFFSDQLLNKDGPLAYAWLAANLEKKLTKQQLMKASITKSAKAVENSSKALDVSDSQRDVEPMALRLSGQLLYGIVRIYSRKSKYLYEDVSDILMRLKASFATSKSVNLPLESTVITSLKTVTMTDTVSEADLLYQRPVDFNEIFESQVSGNEVRASELAPDTDEDTFATANESIELGRNASSANASDDEIEHNRNAQDELEELDDTGGMDLDLDFDIGNTEAQDHPKTPQPDEDDSIEIGRAAETPNMSVLDNTAEAALPELDEPILEAANEDENDINEPSTPPDFVEPSNTSKAAGGKQLEYLKMNVVRTATRRMIVDSITELSAQTLRANQRRYLKNAKRSDTRKHQLSDNNGNDAFSRFAKGLHLHKKRRLELQHDGAEEHTMTENVITDAQVPEIEPDFDDIDVAPQSPVSNISLDLGNSEENEDSIDDFGIEDGQLSDQEHEENQDEETREEETVVSKERKATIHIANCVRKLLTVGDQTFSETPVTFTDILEEEQASEEPVSKNSRVAATATFFELLVLAGNDNVKLNQGRLFGEITVEAKESLATSFV